MGDENGLKFAGATKLFYELEECLKIADEYIKKGGEQTEKFEKDLFCIKYYYDKSVKLDGKLVDSYASTMCHLFKDHYRELTEEEINIRFASAYRLYHEIVECLKLADEYVEKGGERTEEFEKDLAEMKYFCEKSVKRKNRWYGYEASVACMCFRNRYTINK